jgi:predicted transcriptional regulator
LKKEGAIYMSMSLVEMVSMIVAAQATHTRLSPDEVSDTILKTFDTLKRIKAIEGGLEETRTSQGTAAQAIKNPMKSIKKNKVVCLECSKEFRQLTNRHLALHGMNSKEYKKKWGIPAGQSLAAKALTEKRRKLAIKRGLGEKLLAARRKAQKARAAAK